VADIFTGHLLAKRKAVQHGIITEWSSITGPSGCSGTVTTSHTYTVICLDGTQLKLDATLENLGQLGESLERETARYLFPLALSAYQMGKPVSFGLLIVTQEGLFYESNRLLWSEVKSMKISEYYDHIVIKSKGTCFAGHPSSYQTCQMFKYSRCSCTTLYHTSSGSSAT